MRTTKHQLAQAFRAAGFNRLDQREVERRLGRCLNSHERQAYVIACDSRFNPNQLAKQSAKAHDKVHNALKGTRLPKPVGLDQNTGHRDWAIKVSS